MLLSIVHAYSDRNLNYDRKVVGSSPASVQTEMVSFQVDLRFSQHVRLSKILLSLDLVLALFTDLDKRSSGKQN